MTAPLLYHHPLSFGSQLARLALAEKGVAWRGRVIDIGPAHQNFGPWFIQLAPNAEVPVMVTDEDTVLGGLAIAKYVNRHYPGPELSPHKPSQELLCEQWVQRVVHFPIRFFSYASARGLMGLIARDSLQNSRWHLKRRKRKHPELSSAYQHKLQEVEQWHRMLGNKEQYQVMREQLSSALDELEAQLAGGEWITEVFSLADLVWAVTLTRLDLLGFHREWQKGRRPLVEAYYNRLRKRPAFKAARLYRRVPFFKIIPSLIRGYWRRTLLVTAAVLGLLFWPS